MDRRAFSGILAAALLAAPLAAEAQQVKVSRIGFLSGQSPTDLARQLEAFRQGLRELGYVEGRNIAIEYRFAEGRPERLPALAVELVRLKVDIIVTAGPPAPLAAKQATTTIPIVFAISNDPVAEGVVSSLAIKHKLPTVTAFRSIAEQGVLMSFGASVDEQYQRAAVYIDKILKGAKPTDLPIEQPFELVINLRPPASAPRPGRG